MGGKTKTVEKTNSTQTAAPPSWTMPGIQTASDRVIAALNAGQPTPYTGSFVAPINNQGAVDAYTGAAQQGGQLADWTTDKMKGWTPTQAQFTDWSPTNTQAALDSAITAATNPVVRNLMQTVLPGLKSSALDAGAYSGDRAMAILPQLALDDASRNVSEIAAGLSYDNVQKTADRSLSAWDSSQNRTLANAEMLGNQNLQYLSTLPDLVDTAMRMRSGQGDLLSQAAILQRQQQQAAIDEQLAQHDYSVRQPYEGLDIASALLSQLSGNYGTTTMDGTSTRTQSTSGLGPVLQGITGLAGAALSFPTGGGSTLMGSLFSRKPSAPISTGSPSYGTSGLLGGY